VALGSSSVVVHVAHFSQELSANAKNATERIVRAFFIVFVSYKANIREYESELFDIE